MAMLLSILFAWVFLVWRGFYNILEFRFLKGTENRRINLNQTNRKRDVRMGIVTR